MKQVKDPELNRRGKGIAENMIKQLKAQREGATNIGIDVDASIKALGGSKPKPSTKAGRRKVSELTKAYVPYMYHSSNNVT